jgi:hypothetical protein
MGRFDTDSESRDKYFRNFSDRGAGRACLPSRTRLVFFLNNLNNMLLS